jgi:hypothetical protein
MDSAIHNSGGYVTMNSPKDGMCPLSVGAMCAGYNIVTALASNGCVKRPGRCRPRNHCFTVISLTAHPRTASARRNCGSVRPARFRYNSRQSGSRGGNSFFRLIVPSPAQPPS